MRLEDKQILEQKELEMENEVDAYLQELDDKEMDMAMVSLMKA